MATNKNTSEYIQFSKKVTQWGIIAISLGLFLCLLILTIFKVSEEIATILSRLYATYATTLGIIVGAYQGNSTLEKWSKARYNNDEYDELNLEDEREDEI